jgi:S1-C subfamily serine protease
MARLGRFALLIGCLLAWAVRAQEVAPSRVGTGFVVSEAGDIVTAHHVVRDGAEILVGPVAPRRWLRARVVRVDEANDLALLRAPVARPPLTLGRWQEVPVGLEVFVLGYPQPRLQGAGKKITQGIINGERTDAETGRHFQLSAEIQRGNSGGPVLAPDGSVIGVVQSKLNALSVAERTRDLPQNVNYALKSSVLLGFLEGAGVPVTLAGPDLSRSVRAFEVYRRHEASILMVVARKPAARSAIAPGGLPPQLTGE